MRMLLAAVAASSALALTSGCGGGSPQPAATATPAPAGAVTAAAATTAAPTAAASGATASSPTRAPAGATVEVTGIVGSVAQATGLIEIDRLSGAPVRRIAVESTTVLRRAGGGTLSLAMLHPSQRIIAQGTLNDRGDTLLASQVTVQDVVPNVAPGG